MKASQDRILIVGKSGFLGSALFQNLEASGLSVEGTDRSQVDLARFNSSSIKDLIRVGAYGSVVICAAITDVEKCFQEQELSRRVNVSGTVQLLDAIQEVGATPIFFSTDYVFPRRSVSHREDDPRAPETVYGRQKVAVELYLEKNFENYLIFRTSKLMSRTSHPKNILLPVIRGLTTGSPLKCFEDQWLNPVFVEDIAEVLKRAIQKDLKGVYHLGTRRIFTRLELANFLAESLKQDRAGIFPVRMADMKFSEPRPTHNSLDCQKVEKELGFRFKEIEEVIDELRILEN
jgi:dTDP-4-dehydrorhamnose reductase